MNFDEIDLKMLKENFDDEMINKINIENVSKIFKYLRDNNVYYMKDLFISSFDLFLLSEEDFVKKFEKLKSKLGANFVEELGEDSSLIELMYRD